ncbi:hypothetical protein FB451DRAFT_1173020 [Mycena latifolia]|nr:hypothetical protein FB451DRAFT_1173020 [Mycena latifolia]
MKSASQGKKGKPTNVTSQGDENESQSRPGGIGRRREHTAGVYGENTVSGATRRAGFELDGGDVWVTSKRGRCAGRNIDGWDGRVARSWVRSLSVVMEAVEGDMGADPGGSHETWGSVRKEGRDAVDDGMHERGERERERRMLRVRVVGLVRARVWYCARDTTSRSRSTFSAVWADGPEEQPGPLVVAAHEDRRRRLRTRTRQCGGRITAQRVSIWKKKREGKEREEKERKMRCGEDKGRGKGAGEQLLGERDRCWGGFANAEHRRGEVQGRRRRIGEDAMEREDVGRTKRGRMASPRSGKYTWREGGAARARRERKHIGPAQATEVGKIGRNGTGAAGGAQLKVGLRRRSLGFAPAERGAEYIATPEGCAEGRRRVGRRREVEACDGDPTAKERGRSRRCQGYRRCFVGADRGSAEEHIEGAGVVGDAPCDEERGE